MKAIDSVPLKCKTMPIVNITLSGLKSQQFLINPLLPIGSSPSGLPEIGLNPGVEVLPGVDASDRGVGVLDFGTGVVDFSFCIKARKCFVNTK